MSGRQGSSWMCKKATVQVSFNWQVSQMRFYLNSVMNQIYLPNHSFAISLTVFLLLRLNSLATIQYLPASLYTIIIFFFLPSILLSFLPSFTLSFHPSFLPSFFPTYVSTRSPPYLPAYLPTYLRSHRDENYLLVHSVRFFHRLEEWIGKQQYINFTLTGPWKTIPNVFVRSLFIFSWCSRQMPVEVLSLSTTSVLPMAPAAK